MMHIRSFRLTGLLTAVLFVFACTLPASAKQRKNNDPNGSSAAVATAAAPAKDAQASGYVGSQVCKTCHQAEYNSWEKSPHWKTTLNTREGPSHQGCEACHGPGAAHVSSGGDITKIFDFSKASTREITQRCLTCHAGGPQHMNDTKSIHTENGIACTACHSIHHAETAEYFLAKPQPQLCYGCHVGKRAQFSMPFRHRVNDGLIKCTDCHNPHGTEGPTQLRSASTQDAVCFKCHMDKQGPFVYEHGPEKIAGCTSCHLVHGGPNPHMLRYSNVNQLCLQCHTTSTFSSAPGAPGFHNQASAFQSCVQCHSQIHGSNSSQYFFN